MMASDAAPDGRTRSNGLLYILVATAIAGIAGYLIQIVVPAFQSAEDYIVFGAYWSAVYLAVSAASGLQQEIARAARPAHTSSWGTLWRFGAGAALAVALIAVISTPLWAGSVFGPAAPALATALGFAVCGYALIAVLSGALYGVRDWRGVALMTISDSALRVVAVGLALVLGGGVVLLGWAVAVPFALSFVLVLAITTRRVAPRLGLDTGIAGLTRHSFSTVGASLATGVMISGLPLLLGVTVRGGAAPLLASLILVVTLTRAPLVVPLLALQSYLLVTFRDAPGTARKRTAVWGGGLAVLTAVLAALAVIVGPWVVALLYGDRYALPAPAYAAIVASAGLTGILCITGPAVLAAGRHAAYVAGWAAASAALVIGLAIFGSDFTAAVLTICLAPVAGIATHAVALMLRHSASTPGHLTG